MSQGHPDARHYPLCTLWHEADLARKRINLGHVTEALLIQSAVASLLDKQAAKDFQSLIRKLSDGN